MVIVGGAFYLGDCLIAHKSHPDVPFVKTGFYNWGPLGIVATVIWAAAGVYCFVKRE